MMTIGKRSATRSSAMTARHARGRWRSRLLLLAAVCLGSAVTLNTLAAPKPGVVKDKRGNTYSGQVDEAAAPGRVVVIGPNGAKTEIFTQNVDSITYFNSPQEEFNARLAALGRQDGPGRIALAKWALSQKEVDLAAVAVAQAKAIDPASVEVAALEKQIASLKAPPPPATQTAVPPPVGPGTNTKPPPPAAQGPARRMVSPDEIQLIRQREMADNEKGLRVQVSAPLRKKAIEAGVLRPNEANLPPLELGLRILRDAPPSLQKEVKILNDPAAINDFRTKVNPRIVAGCAAAACHGQAAAGGFALFAPAEKEEAALSNFILLAKYEKKADGNTVPMINRTQPANSLLLGYLMPPELSRMPHPQAPGYKGAVRNATDPAFLATGDWIAKSLKAFPPNYDDIDLTQAPKPANGAQ